MQASNIRARRRASMEGLETRLLWSVTLNTQGWTVVTPSPGERIIYVSNEGSDNNSGFSATSSVKSFAKAQSLLINNQPNEILLKSGETFTDAFLNWKASGADSQDPILISYYGTGPRPLIYSGTAGTGFATAMYSNSGAVVNYLDLIGLQFDANMRDTSLGTVSTSFTGEVVGFEFEANGGNVLIEDCSFSYYAYENILIEATTSGNSPYQSPSVSNITIRRSVDANSYAFNGGHSQGLYAYTVNNLTIYQCVFDHDGWNATPGLGATDIGFNHDIYIASTCSGINISDNIIAEASYAGIMARAGGIIDNNQFIDNAVAVAFGAADGADSKIGGVSGQLIGNTVVGDKASGSIGNNPLAFGEGFVIANTAPGANVLVQSNIFTQDSQNAKPAILLEVPTSTYNPSQNVGINDLTIQGNILNGWRVGIETDGRFVGGGTGLYALNNLKVIRNDYINSSTQEVRHDGVFATGYESWTGDRFYDTVLKQASWITLQSQATTFATWQTYDLGATILPAIPYTNINVSISSYDATLGGPGTWQDFLTQARSLSIYNYQPQYMALASVSYIQAGFNVSAIISNFGPGTPPTAAAVAPQVNLSNLNSSSYTFTVNYTDGATLNTTSLGNGNLLVVGPNGYAVFATYVSSTTPLFDSSGYQHISSTYSIIPPNTAWARGEDGTYSIDLLAKQVTDSNGNSATDGVIGTFNANFVAPTASAVTPNLTTGGGGSYSFSVTYNDPVGVDPSTLAGGQIQVSSTTGGYSRYASLVSEVTNANGSVTAYLSIQAPGGSWSNSANGTYTVTQLAGSVYDLAGNPVPAGTLSTFSVAIGAAIAANSSSISGIVFNDGPGTGVYNSRDNTLAGVTVFIDINGTGVLSAGDISTTTDQNGNYSFTNLSAGRYTVIEVPPSGFTVTSPSTGSNVITLTSGQATTSVNFANQTGTTVASGNGPGSTSGGSTGTGKAGSRSASSASTLGSNPLTT